MQQPGRAVALSLILGGLVACSGPDEEGNSITITHGEAGGGEGDAGHTSSAGGQLPGTGGHAGEAGGGEAAGSGGSTDGGQGGDGGAAAGDAGEGGSAGDEGGQSGASGQGGATSAGGAAGKGGASGKGGSAGAAGKAGAGGTAGTGGASGLPACDCFVKVSWCGAGVAEEAADKKCSVPLLPAHKGDLLGCSGDTWIVKDACEFGCNQAPAGTPDTCKPDPSATCTIQPGKAGKQLKWGLHPDASDALRKLGLTADDVWQTIGDASASAGTHAQDGTAEGYAYSAATDLRTTGMTEKQIGQFLDDLAHVGFVAWYRKPGYDGWPSSEVKHIHAIWVGAKMKLSLRNQVRDFRVGKNGLTSHTVYKFHTWSQCWRDALWDRYLTHNPAKN